MPRSAAVRVRDAMTDADRIAKLERRVANLLRIGFGGPISAFCPACDTICFVARGKLEPHWVNGVRCECVTP